jgi:hypothetical protein
VAAVAERTGLDSSVIRTYIAARMADNAARGARAAERARQLSMCFEEVGA